MTLMRMVMAALFAAILSFGIPLNPAGALETSRLWILAMDFADGL